MAHTSPGVRRRSYQTSPCNEPCQCRIGTETFLVSAYVGGRRLNTAQHVWIRNPWWLTCAGQSAARASTSWSKKEQGNVCVRWTRDFRSLHAIGIHPDSLLTTHQHSCSHHCQCSPPQHCHGVMDQQANHPTWQDHDTIMAVAWIRAVLRQVAPHKTNASFLHQAKP